MCNLDGTCWEHTAHFSWSVDSVVGWFVSGLGLKLPQPANPPKDDSKVTLLCQPFLSHPSFSGTYDFSYFNWTWTSAIKPLLLVFALRVQLKFYRKVSSDFMSFILL